MDDNITKGLEIGVAFAIFVAGLGMFFVMSQSMSRYLIEANKYTAVEENFSQSDDQVSISDTTIEELYYMLQNEDGIDIFIDGTRVLRLDERLNQLETVTPFEAIATIKQTLYGIGYKTFDEQLVFDGDYKVVRINYTHN